MRVNTNTLFQIGQEMQAARKATEVAQTWAANLGYSYKTIFKKVRDAGFYESGKKKRHNAGRLDPVLQDHIYKIAAVYHTIPRKRKPGIEGKMPLELAVEMYRDSLDHEIELPTPGRIYQILRQQKISRRHKKLEKPKLRMKTLHPNHVFCYDTGVCNYWMDPDGKIQLIPRAHDYPGKERYNKKTRLVRHIIIDMFTGAFFVWYTFQQKRVDYFEFLYKAFAQKEGGFIFHGLPGILLMDNDIGLRSHILMRFLAYLNIKVPVIEPYSPWVKGTVEDMMKQVARWFESRLMFQETADIDKINEWANAWAIKFQKTRKHSRHKMSRFECWDRYIINPETGESHLREIPDFQTCQKLLHFDPEPRNVNKQGEISYKGKTYIVPGLYNTKVDVIEHLYLYEKNNAITVSYPSAEECKDNYLDFEIQKVTLLPDETGVGNYPENAVVIGDEYGRLVNDRATKNLKIVADLTEDVVKQIKPMNFTDNTGIEFIPKTGTLVEVATEQDYSENMYTKRQVKLEVSRQLRRPLNTFELTYIADLEDRKFSTEEIKGFISIFVDNSQKNRKKRS